MGPPTAPAARADLRDVGVGPLMIRLETRGARLGEALRDAFAGYREPTGPAGLVGVHLDASLDAPVVAGLPELPRLVPDGAGRLRDASEGFELTVSPGFPLHVRAHLRDYGGGDGAGAELLRRQLEGLTRVALATAAPARGAVLLHGCAVLFDGMAHVFLGASGDGKTTMARRLGARGATVLADDTVLVVRAGARGAVVSGTPFAGKEGLPRSGEAWPLGRILTLAPGAPLALTPLAPPQVLEALISRALWYASAWQAGTVALLDMLSALAAEIPGARLASTLDDDVFSMLAGGLHREEVRAC